MRWRGGIDMDTTSKGEATLTGARSATIVST
jgi:hypothetical protein